MKFKFGKDTEQKQITKIELQEQPIGDVDIKTPSEIKDALVELNEDKSDKDTNMSSIDFKARISPFEEKAMLVIDGLISLNAMPIEVLAITRQKKRLSVSRQGKGREEMLKAIIGGKDRQEKKGLFQKIRGFVGL